MSKTKTLKIFLVDDEPFYLNILQQIIHILGYENITIFDNGTSCLDKLNEKPDIIFLDYNMSTLTGNEVLRKIKKYNPDIYVVMLSSQVDFTPVINSLKLGAFDYIQKGDNDQKKVKEVIEKIIEIKELFKNTKPNLLNFIFKFL